ncbi:uncharacterized protein LOC126841912 [Adelges cooleyi]|uniref:uncharacterized protein LOC126841912 n=1 Tax=Adelges cooleyi TaxID=133065 RepID=UPI0021805C6A|nr:uncharacterized protein LOC126841912 [Adelges cooleyi]XP_050434664.1 uncharacterized protein LOC126841912 [Adelges cooleyi]
MNLYWFLLSFAIVNVLAELIQDYVNLVSTTNKYIEYASKQEPVKADPVWNVRVYTPIEYIIKRILLKNKYTMEKLAYMLTGPDFAEEFQDLNKCMEYQNILQTEILEAIALDYTVEYAFETHTSRDLGVTKLISDGIERRKMIYPDLVSLIESINDEIEEDFTPTQICQLIGLYKNSNDSISELTFIITAKVDSVGHCCLTSNDNQTTYYKLIPPPTENIVVEFFPDYKETELLLPVLPKNKNIDVHLSETDEN